MSTVIQELAESLKQIRTKSESWHDMSIDAGVSAKTLATIVKYPERSYSMRTIEKITEYIRQTENKPEPLSIQDINFLQSQNKELREQNRSLQEENNKYRRILQEVRTSLREVLFRWELPPKETQDKVLHILKKISEVEVIGNRYANAELLERTQNERNREIIRNGRS